jgi:transposase
MTTQIQRHSRRRAEQLALPQLTPAELEAVFGTDVVAKRRYHALALLAQTGSTQREAAHISGLSTRTLRKVLRAFQVQGLAGLRSPRRAGHRCSTHHAERAEALHQAQQLHPDAGGDRLWRAAQALLLPAGPPLSRRTAYRILAQLRAAEPPSTAPMVSLALLRPALRLLILDPPLDLGHTLLAQLLFPKLPRAQARGLQLRQALHIVIARLQPPNTVPPTDHRWWPYRICEGEYIQGQSRAALQQALAVSESTYSRAKRAGLRRIAALLPTLRGCNPGSNATISEGVSYG